MFDEVASGLGALSDCRHRVPSRGGERRRTRRPGSLARLGDLQHQLDERDGWRLEQKVELVVSRLGLPAERRDAANCRAAGGGACCSARRSCPSPTCCCSTNRPITSTSLPSAGWRISCAGLPAPLLFVTHDRAFLGNLATRIVELDRGRLTSWPGTYARYLSEESGSARMPRRCELERLDKKLEKEEAWLRQGVKARRTRNEGRVRT